MSIALIGTAIAAGSSILGSSKARGEQEKKEREINRMLSENESQYLQDKYTNSLDSPTSKAYLKRIDKDAEKQVDKIENQATSGGATQENVLAAKQSVNEAKSDAVNNVIINDQQTQRVAKENYLSRKMGLEAGQLGTFDMKSQNWSNLGAGIGGAAMNLGSSYLSGDMKGFGKKSTLPQGTSVPAASESNNYWNNLNLA